MRSVSIAASSFIYLSALHRRSTPTPVSSLGFLWLILLSSVYFMIFLSIWLFFASDWSLLGISVQVCGFLNIFLSFYFEWFTLWTLWNVLYLILVVVSVYSHLGNLLFSVSGVRFCNESFLWSFFFSLCGGGNWIFVSHFRFFQVWLLAVISVVFEVWSTVNRFDASIVHNVRFNQGLIAYSTPKIRFQLLYLSVCFHDMDFGLLVVVINFEWRGLFSLT